MLDVGGGGFKAPAAECLSGCRTLAQPPVPGQVGLLSGAILCAHVGLLSPNHGTSPGRAAGMQAQSSEPVTGRHSSQFCLHYVQLTCNPLFFGQRVFRGWVFGLVFLKIFSFFWLSLDLKTKKGLNIEVSDRQAE